mmetsp:Transcript_21518/g.43110  ORF Transcript_21518/g.43110 Transcript_21518/m.43110 type:complete len:237 (+) Transcript_21518:4927-5637(+)
MTLVPEQFFSVGKPLDLPGPQLVLLFHLLDVDHAADHLRRGALEGHQLHPPLRLHDAVVGAHELPPEHSGEAPLQILLPGVVLDNNFGLHLVVAHDDRPELAPARGRVEGGPRGLGLHEQPPPAVDVVAHRRADVADGRVPEGLVEEPLVDEGAQASHVGFDDGVGRDQQIRRHLTGEPEKGGIGIEGVGRSLEELEACAGQPGEITHDAHVFVQRTVPEALDPLHAGTRKDHLIL